MDIPASCCTSVYRLTRLGAAPPHVPMAECYRRATGRGTSGRTGPYYWRLKQCRGVLPVVLQQVKHEKGDPPLTFQGRRLEAGLGAACDGCHGDGAGVVGDVQVLAIATFDHARRLGRYVD